MALKCSWTDTDMLRAYEAVTKYNSPISTAAKVYGIPRMTLSDRIKGKTKVDAKMGRKLILGEKNEAALLRYIKYMAEHRYPITRTQVMGLAWAISLQDEDSDSFGASGPSLRWWRGFRDRHKEISLRKSESVDRGRVANAVPDIINDYFDVLTSTLTDHNLTDKPGQIYNCDEAAIFLNRSSEKVLVPVKNKHCHIMAQGTNEHISVLCCVNASGESIPPLIIYSKGLPSSRTYQEEGPQNATYSSTDSGFIDKEIYQEWFEKNFLPFASKERPLLLLQDGAAAHISPKLIDMAISNDVVLLCFPPKLTHILQPLDVAIYRRMKSELSHVMHQVKMLRHGCWINKSKFPGVFKEVMQKTFTSNIISEAFRKCGIYPLNRNAISQELVQKPNVTCDTNISHPRDDSLVNVLSSQQQLSDAAKLDSDHHKVIEHIPPICISDNDTRENSVTEFMDDNPSEENIINIINIQVESVESIPPESEVSVVVDGSNVPSICPPQLAVEAIEQSLTPKKKKSFMEKYAADVNESKDVKYMTWRTLKKKSEVVPPAISSPESHETNKELPTNPLVTAGIIPEHLSDILLSPDPPRKHSMHVGKRRTTKARVLTSSEISNHIRETERAKHELEKEKQNRKNERAKKKLFNETQKVQNQKKKQQKKAIAEEKRLAKCKAQSVAAHKRLMKQRDIYYEKSQQSLMKCEDFTEFVECCKNIKTEEIIIHIPTSDMETLDVNASDLLSEMTDYNNLTPITIPPYGDCLPCSGSFYAFGNVEHHIEIRVRIAVELAIHSELYLDDQFLASGVNANYTPRTISYAMFSKLYCPGATLPQESVRKIFESEIMNIVKPGKYMGIWQMHGLASVLGANIQSVYPGLGSVERDLHRLIVPREIRYENKLYIFWTHTANKTRSTWWEPNHFVPLISAVPQTIRPVIRKSQVMLAIFLNFY